MILIKYLRIRDSFLTTQKYFCHFKLQVFIGFTFVLDAGCFEILCAVIHYNVKREKIIQFSFWAFVASTWNYKMIKLILFVDNSINFVFDNFQIAWIFISFVDRSLKLLVWREILNIIACRVCIYQRWNSFRCKVQIIVLRSVIIVI